METKMDFLLKNVRSASAFEESTRGITFAYNLNGVWYSSDFPIKYALSHEKGTGPIMCKKCSREGVNSSQLFEKYCRSCQEWYDGNVERNVRNMRVATQNNVKIEKGKCRAVDCPMDAVSGKRPFCHNHWEECV